MNIEQLYEYANEMQLTNEEINGDKMFESDKFEESSMMKELIDGKLIKAIIQIGEVFGECYEWYEKYETTLCWSECNQNDELGVCTSDGYGWAGYKDGIYHRYKVPNYEHVMRVVRI